MALVKHRKRNTMPENRIPKLLYQHKPKAEDAIDV
jgi:hypothetical protein